MNIELNGRRRDDVRTVAEAVAAATAVPMHGSTSVAETGRGIAVALNGEDVLLRTEMAAGHGGVSGRYKAWKDRAFTLAWVLDRMGLAGSPDRVRPSS